MEFNAVLGIFIFIFGAMIGSFLNVVILRLPRGQKLTGRGVCHGLVISVAIRAFG